MTWSCALNLALVAVIARISLVIADILVLVVTWLATYRSSRDRHKVSFARILLRDGEPPSARMDITTPYVLTSPMVVQVPSTFCTFSGAGNLSKHGPVLNGSRQRSAPAKPALLHSAVSHREYSPITVPESRSSCVDMVVDVGPGRFVQRVRRELARSTHHRAVSFPNLHHCAHES